MLHLSSNHSAICMEAIAATSQPDVATLLSAISKKYFDYSDFRYSEKLTLLTPN